MEQAPAGVGQPTMLPMQIDAAGQPTMVAAGQPTMLPMQVPAAGIQPLGGAIPMATSMGMQPAMLAAPIGLPMAPVPMPEPAPADGGRRVAAPKKDKKGGGAVAGGPPGGKGRGKGGKGKTPWRPFDGPGAGGGYRLNVKNLTTDMSNDQALRQLFMPFGNVVDAGIKKKEDGTNRNFGFVVMASEPEGLNAMNQMNGKHIGGKQLKVVPAERRADDPELAAAQGPMPGMPGGAMMLPGMPGMPGMPGADPLAGVAGMDNMAMVQMQMQALQLQQTMLMQAAMLQQPGGGANPGIPAGAGAQNPLLLQAGMMNPLLSAPGGLGLPMGLPGLPGMGLPSTPEYEGTLKSISAKNGYGFLDCPETYNLYQRDVYVDKERLPLDASQGDRFRFTVEMSEKGQPKAGNLMKA